MFTFSMHDCVLDTNPLFHSSISIFKVQISQYNALIDPHISACKRDTMLQTENAK